MCVAPGPFVNMLDFQQPKKVAAFIDVILLRTKGLSIALICRHTWYDSDHERVVGDVGKASCH
jgi:hypothetical protein